MAPIDKVVSIGRQDFGKKSRRQFSPNFQSWESRFGRIVSATYYRKDFQTKKQCNKQILA